METPIIEKVIEQLKRLPQELQGRVLEYTRSLAGTSVRGVPGRQLLSFAGGLSAEDASLMREAIES